MTRREVPLHDVDVLRRTPPAASPSLEGDKLSAPVKVQVSRFNASIFEIVHVDGKQRAFVKREDPEYLEALQAESAYEAKVKKLPFGLGRLVPPPTIEIEEARWNRLRQRISGSFPVLKL